MGLFANFTRGMELAGGKLSSTLANYANDDIPQSLGKTTINPMQAILDDCQGPCYISDLVDKGIASGLSAEKALNFEGVVSDQTLVVRQEDIGYIQDLLRDEGAVEGNIRLEKPILASGSDLSWHFAPYATSEYVESTLTALDGATIMNGAEFVSPPQGEAREVMPELRDVQLNGFSIQPAHDGQYGNVALSLTGVEACNADIRGHNNRLTAYNSDLSGVNAEGSSNLMLDITCSKLNAGTDGLPANFNNVRLGVDSRIAGSEIDATFHNATLDRVDMRNSLLKTPGMFEGARFGSGAKLEGAIAAPDVFIGALGPDGKVITAENVGVFMQTHGVKDAVAAGYAPPSPESEMREAIRNGSDLSASAATLVSGFGTATAPASVALGQSDGMEAALAKAYSVAQTLQGHYAGTEIVPEGHETKRHAVDHSAEYNRSATV